MTRRAWLYLAGLSAGLVLPRALDAQDARPARTAAQKIQDAMSAAPASVAAQAAIVDWPMAEGASMRELRAGTNGWVCHPTSPQVFAGAAGRDPMCLDAEWQALIRALASRGTPTIRRLGIAYMLQGDAGASNTDPFATQRTADNAWIRSGPHLMLVTPDRALLDAMTDDPRSGGPWVMWKGTPYAHLMIPVSAPAGQGQRPGRRGPN